jgi:hypothetical protein
VGASPAKVGASFFGNRHRISLLALSVCGQGVSEEQPFLVEALKINPKYFCGFVTDFPNAAKGLTRVPEDVTLSAKGYGS